MQLVNQNFTVYYTDTDSLLVVKPITEDLPFCLKDTPGFFRNEYPDETVVSFLSVGPKSYCLRLKNTRGQIREVIKCAGLSRTFSDGRGIGNDEYLEQVNSFKENIRSFLKVPHAKKGLSNQQLRYIKKEGRFTFAVTQSKQRVVDTSSPNLASKPYGYHT